MRAQTSQTTYRRRFAVPSVLLVIILLPSLLIAATPSPASAVTTPVDAFNRAQGPLGPNWTAMTDGAMAISAQAVLGTGSSYSGAIRAGELYSANQSSQIQITAPQLTGNQLIGAAVRAGNGGRNLYLGAYVWNNGVPSLRLYKRVNGTWTQLGSYNSGVLAA